MTGLEQGGWADLLPLTALYAETHYRFRCFPFSLYFRREPEILFDAPHRVEPNRPVPVSLLIKDAHRFPVRVREVTLQVRSSRAAGGQSFSLDWSPEQPLEHRIFPVSIEGHTPGELQIEAAARVEIRGRTKTVRNDNHPGLSHLPLRVTASGEPLPVGEGWSAGELHCHTDYGFDQVEFGAPLAVYQSAAAAMGLGWVCLTDHSYNLDDDPNDYLRDHPEAPKWEMLQAEARRLNAGDNSVQLLVGEELSCRSAAGRNVHLLIVGNPEFLWGTGDGAQKWFRTRSEHSVSSALERVSPTAFAAAAHPFERVPALERILVGRGEWQMEDLAHPRLDAWQISNGDFGAPFLEGKERWKGQLGKGRRLTIVGGNDAHGNLNRFRQVRLPMVSLWEHHRHLFGRVTTRLFTHGRRDVNTFIEALKAGLSSLSDGPHLEFPAMRETDREGGLLRAGIVRLSYASSSEFGEVDYIELFAGGDDGREQVCFRWGTGGEPLNDLLRGEVSARYSGIRYLRAELHTRSVRAKPHFCALNPVWIKH